MTDTIGVKLAADDAGFAATAKKAASAVAAITAQEEKLAKASAAANVDQKKFAQQFRAIEKTQAAAAAKEQKAAASLSLKQAKEETRAADKAAKAQVKAEKAKISAADKAAKTAAKDDERAKKKATADRDKSAKKAADQAKKAQAFKRKASDDESAQLKEGVALLGKSAGAAVAVGAAVLGIATAGAIALVSVAKIALAFGNAKAEALGALDILTNGRGPQALALIDKEAVRLGLDIQQTREDFIKFRQAGLDNKQSAALLKLKADLIATKRPASQVQEAVDRVLSYASNGPQTKDQAAAAGRAMKLLAKQAHIAGDGTAAAAAAVSTLEGALSRIDNTKTKVLEGLGERIKPSIDKAATAIANLVEGFVSSKRGQQAIEAVGDAIIATADAVVRLAPRAAEAWAYVSKAFESPKAALALDALQGVGYLAAAALGALAVGAAAIVVPLAAIGAAGVAAIAGLGLVAKKAVDLVPQMYDAGKNIVLGLAKGVTDAASSAVDAVVSLADRMTKGFKGALGIHSPSRVFEKDGINIGKGVERGTEKSMPTGKEMAERMRPKLALVPALRPAASAVSSKAGDTYQVTVQLSGSGSITPEDEESLRRTLDKWYYGIQQQQGRAA